MFKPGPLTIQKIRRFQSIKRGYYSLLGFGLLCFLSLFAELLINSRALVVKYEGQYYFPTYGDIIPGDTFGFDYPYETNYRDLQRRFEKEESTDNFLVMPVVPFNEFEIAVPDGEYPPLTPNLSRSSFLGTDSIGRDLVARLFYGFRIAVSFSMLLLFFNYLLGVSIGCAMGYFGGAFDIILQRLIEIWNNVPFLYVIIIISSIMVPSFLLLVSIMVFFGWMGMTWYMRTETYREKSREYVLAAQSIGASKFRIIFHHIVPNSLAVIITFLPFSVSGGMVALVSLDFLGFGLPAPTASWGELLYQGIENRDHGWIIWSVITNMVVVLTMVTFIGEAVREAVDPKKFTVYE